MSILFANVLPRHSFTAGLLGKLLNKLCLGNSIHAAWLALNRPLSLEGIYGFLRRARNRLGGIRTALLDRAPPSRSTHADPLLQTFEHLRSVFKGENCPIAAFQESFQTPLMG